jgi:hypothetical protein
MAFGSAESRVAFCFLKVSKKPARTNEEKIFVTGTAAGLEGRKSGPCIARLSDLNVYLEPFRCFLNSFPGAIQKYLDLATAGLYGFYPPCGQ